LHYSISCVIECTTATLRAGRHVKGPPTQHSNKKSQRTNRDSIVDPLRSGAAISDSNECNPIITRCLECIGKGRRRREVARTAKVYNVIERDTTERNTKLELYFNVFSSKCESSDINDANSDAYHTGESFPPRLRLRKRGNTMMRL